MIGSLLSRFRGWIAVLLAGGVVVGGGAMMLTATNHNVHIGPTPTPTATPTGTPTATPTPTPIATANLWVDTNGGTCTRQGTKSAYSDAAACGDFDTAYANASLGDLVAIRPGDYPKQVMNGPQKTPAAEDDQNGANDIVFQGQTNDGSTRVTGAGGANDYLMDLGTGSGTLSEVTFRNLVVTDPTRSCASGAACGSLDKLIDLANTTDVDFDNVDLDRAYKVGDGLGVSGNVDGTDYVNSDICCNAEGKLVMIQQPGGFDHAANDFRMENVDVHDQVYTATSYPGEPPHFEGLWITGDSDGLSFINWRCYLAASTGCANWGGTGTKTNVLFRNCLMAKAYGFANGTDVVAGAGVGYRGDEATATVQGANLSGTGTIENCVMGPGSVDLSSWSSLTVRSSVIGNSTCQGGVTYSYVIQPSGSACGTNGSTVAGVFNSSNLTNVDTADYSLPSCSSVLVNAGHPSIFPATDALGVARPVGVAPDIGPYERVGC